MTSSTRTSFFAALIAALSILAVAITTFPASASSEDEKEDKIVLKDGRVIEGEIVRETDDVIWVNMGIATPSFAKSDIVEIKRASDEPVTDQAVKKKDKNKIPPDNDPPGTFRGVVITAEGMVGRQMAAQPLKEIIPWLEENGVDIVIYKVNSGGGFTFEVERLSQMLHNEYKPRFITAAWIRSAISAASMTSHTLEDIYFFPEGNYGSAVEFSGAGESTEQRDERDHEQNLYSAEHVSDRGNKDYVIMKAMQMQSPLSYTKDPDTGEVTWYDSLEGEVILNRENDVFSFTAQQAEASGFSAGTAGTLEQLTAELKADHPEIKEIIWLGEERSGELYPVSWAEEHQRQWRDDMTRFEQDFGRVNRDYAEAFERASSAPEGQRGALINRALRSLGRLQRMINQNPTMAIIYGYSDIWFREQRLLLDELR